MWVSYLGRKLNLCPETQLGSWREKALRLSLPKSMPIPGYLKVVPDKTRYEGVALGLKAYTWSSVHASHNLYATNKLRTVYNRSDQGFQRSLKRSRLRTPATTSNSIVAPQILKQLCEGGALLLMITSGTRTALP